MPPSGQIIEDKLLQQIPVRISQLTVNTSVFAQKCVAENGAEYIDLKVQPSNSTIAGTTDGRFYIRIGDQSTILHPDQLLRLLTDKPSYSWELKTTRTPRDNYDPNKFAQFVLDVRSSKRVSQFVKDKTEEELLDYYFLAEGEFLTNLGILWIGKRENRAKLKYAPAIQFIKYDERGNKVNKIVWDDYSLNPKELIEVVWNEIPDWKEGLEISDGLFRDLSLIMENAPLGN